MTNSEATSRAAAVTAIQVLFDAGCAAWNRGDLAGYLDSYWKSEKIRWVSGGTVLYGFEAIAAGYRRRFAPPRPMGTLTISGLEIDLVSETDAVVFGHWALAMADQAPHGVFTVHARRIAGEWLFISDHASNDA